MSFSLPRWGKLALLSQIPYPDLRGHFAGKNREEKREKKWRENTPPPNNYGHEPHGLATR